MNSYEEKQEARRERYEELARKNKAEGSAMIDKAHDMASVIPFGQPILVGHHSEKRDRNYRGRIERNFERGFEAHEKAKYYEQKAEAVGKGGISSDDPDAVDKLIERCNQLEADQEYMKRINRLHGCYLKDPASIDKESLTEKEKQLITAYKPTYSWEPHPFAPFQLTNNSANIRRVRQRIEQLKKAPTETKEQTINGVQVVENADLNRIQFLFPGKPSQEVRTLLKQNGFRWSPTNTAWQRHLNNAGRYAARYVLSKLDNLVQS